MYKTTASDDLRDQGHVEVKEAKSHIGCTTTYVDVRKSKCAPTRPVKYITFQQGQGSKYIYPTSHQVKVNPVAGYKEFICKEDFYVVAWSRLARR